MDERLPLMPAAIADSKADDDGCSEQIFRADKVHIHMGERVDVEHTGILKKRCATAESSVWVRLSLAIAVISVALSILGLVRSCSQLTPGRLQGSPDDPQKHGSSPSPAKSTTDWDLAVLKSTYPHRLGLDNGLGSTPPLGWNSWNTLGCEVDEKSVMAVADLVVSLGLKDAGYEYINVDDCWASGRADDGTVIVNPTTFPSGMEALADYVHSLGLKFGIYSDAGHLTCAGCPGSWGHEEIDAKTYASWGVDYLKYDNCNADDLPGPRVRYPIMRDALNATGRPIFYSMCEWGYEDPATWAGDVGNSWRTTADIEPAWSYVVDILMKNNKWAEYAGPGGFNDPDMLEVGVPANRFGPGLTAEEERSHFVLWALMKSPLLIGADLRNISDASLNLLKNKEVIAVNQDPLGIQGRMVYHDKDNPDCQVWGVPLKGSSAAAALFNAGDDTCIVKLMFEDLGYAPGSAADIRDILAQFNIGIFRGSYSAIVPPRDVHFLKVDLLNL